jgi:hypothetical protein
VGSGFLELQHRIASRYRQENLNGIVDVMLVMLRALRREVDSMVSLKLGAQLETENAGQYVSFEL